MTMSAEGKRIASRGYIELNFYNLFWIFVVCSVLGLAIETVAHLLIYGSYQNRVGLLYGPFSPIYGVGALLMTVTLNRFYKAHVVAVFLVSALIGGAFEYFTSWFMQVAFGAVAWDYTGMWLSIGGRTCGMFMVLWGLLGTLWIKVLLPVTVRIIDMIPPRWRHWLTVVCAVLMAADIAMSLAALECWYGRMSGKPVTGAFQQFFADHFDNTYMENKFQTMTIHPESSLRGK